MARITFVRKAASSGPPVIRVERARGFGLGLREIWDYRELLYFFIWRDVKVRYKQTVLGAVWAVLQPLLMMVVFSIFLGKLAKVPSEGVSYPLFVYAGLVPWTLFAKSLDGASNSFIDSANLVSKVYFPRVILPLAAAGSHVLDFAVSLLLLVGMAVLFGVHPTLAIAWVVAFTVVVLLASLAVGIWLAALNVKYRDVRHVVPFLLQVGLFATPVVYPSTIVPARWRPLLGLNPMAGVVEGLRWALLHTRRPGPELGVSLGMTLVLLTVSLVYLHRAERTFADWI